MYQPKTRSNNAKIEYLRYRGAAKAQASQDGAGISSLSLGVTVSIASGQGDRAPGLGTLVQSPHRLEGVEGLHDKCSEEYLHPVFDSPQIG
jgi:hypothetical protein